MKLKSNLFGLLSLVASVSLMAPGCGTSSKSNGETSETSGGSGTESNGDESDDWSSTDDGSSTSAEDTTTTDATTATDTADTGSFVSDTGDTTDDTGSGPQPNGSPCAGRDECESEICVQLPMIGGVCSECETDQDCIDNDLGLNCSIGQSGYFECTDGGLGTMCMSDEGCDGELVCAQLVDLGGLFNDQFCSECNEDSQCADGELCTPVLDGAGFAGYRECSAAGSVQQDSICDVNEHCASGFCSTASVMGFLEIGVCGECLSDMDCTMGSCMDATIDIQGGGLFGSTCG